MRPIPLTILLVFVGTGLLAAEEKPPLRFGKDNLGKLPAGWKAAKTGEGEGSRWKVVADATAPSKTGHVLAQTAASPRVLFNLCVADDSNVQDIAVSVALKAVKGKVDQGGGVVWRYQDADNYYVARLNPLEFNLRIYKVVEGKRIQLATREELDVKAGQWYTLRIKHTGRTNAIECLLDGKKLLSVENESTINRAGKVGLWTKADAHTHFDDFQVRDRSK